jgi:hypothetical protein
MTASIKKFKCREGVTNETIANDVTKTETDVLMAKMTPIIQDVLLTKGWKPPSSGRKRSRSVSPKKPGAYKGKKNPLDRNFKQMKCFKCKCDHVEKCNCACVYHLANTCPSRRELKKEGAIEEKQPDMSLYMETMMTDTGTTSGDLVLLISESIEVLNITSVNSEAVIDCACPTTVTGIGWMEKFIEGLSEIDRRRIVRTTSEKMFRFGGGEKKRSMERVRFPCNIAGKNVFVETEVVDTEFGLLLGNNTMRRAGGALFWTQKKARFLGSIVELRKTTAGHFSISVERPIEGQVFVKSREKGKNDIEAICMHTEKVLEKEDVRELHYQYRQGNIKKVEI